MGVVLELRYRKISTILFSSSLIVCFGVEIQEDLLRLYFLQQILLDLLRQLLFGLYILLEGSLRSLVEMEEVKCLPMSAIFILVLAKEDALKFLDLSNLI